MAISLTNVVNLAASILNASRRTYGTITDPLHPSQELKDAAFTADKQIVSCILDTKGHRSRRAWVQQITVGDGMLIPDPFEGGVLIDGNPGKYLSPSALARIRVNPNNNSRTHLMGFYTIQGDTISFNGSVCKIDVIRYVPGSNLQAPDEMIGGVVAGVLAYCFVKEGTQTAAGEHFASLFSKCLELIKGGATSLPAPSPFT